MVACFRIGAVVLACNEQLRAKDLRLRLDAADPKLIVADERNSPSSAARRPSCEVALIPDESLFDGPSPRPPVELDADRPVPDHVHERHDRRGQGHRPRPALPPRPAPPGLALARRAATATWSGARRPAAGRSRRATRSSRRGSRAPRRCCTTPASIPFERLEILAAERVNVLCMAPTEYRVIAKRADLEPLPELRGLVAAGEALNPEVLRAFREGTGIEIRDGYGQTETGQLTGDPAGGAVRPGSMGRPLPGVALEVDRRRARARRPVDRPDVLRRLSRWRAGAPEQVPWRTGDRVALRRRRLPVLRGPHRRPDHLRRVPDRPVRGRVGARLASRGRRGGGGRGARRRARLGRPRGGRAARRLRPSGRASRTSSRSTSRPRPPRTSTPGSSTSPPSCRRPPAARSSARCCARSAG